MRAIVMDFDGLVMDTESTDFESWRIMYARFDVDFPRVEWIAAIGTDGRGLNPGATLSAATGLPENGLREERRAIRDVMVSVLQPLPGVREWLNEATELGLRVGIASSSPEWWVKGHLERVGLFDHFEVLATEEDVESVKPDPAVYQVALKRMGAEPSEALAIEDSPNGMAAAQAAGIPCLAVPGPMTEDLEFSGARLRIGSLSERSLASVLLELRAAV